MDLYGHGSEPRKYMDSPVHGLPVIIEINRKRFRCKSCSKTAFQPLEDMDDCHQATSRLVKYVGEKALNQTFASVAREVGMDEKSVKVIFSEIVQSLDANFETPAILGIDDVKCAGSYRTILTDIQKRSVFDLLDSVNYTSLRDYFNSLNNKNNISHVVMDPSHTFRKVVNDELPECRIVADRFHVTKLANDALEKVRRRTWRTLGQVTKESVSKFRHMMKKRRKSLTEDQIPNLEVLLSITPDLRAAYQAKEDFCALYEYGNREEAERAAGKWQAELPPTIKADFTHCLLVLKNWQEEIFNFYDQPETNAFTESANRILKDITRMGRGYSFEVIRAKLLYNLEARKVTKQSIRKHIRKEVQTREFSFALGAFKASPKLYETVEVLEHVEYGADIDTLLELLKRKEIF